jgi:ribose 5-phosphate isomerase B
MNVAIASDHRGVRVKAQILAQIKDLGHNGIDFGPSESKSVDYPDYAFRVAAAVTSGQVDRGILICGTGMGMCIAANKIAGVRAVTCHDDVTAEYSRRHNNANVMCLSADMLGDRLLGRIVEIWLRTEFEGGRHQRRLEKISEFEKSHGIPEHELNGTACCEDTVIAIEEKTHAPGT